MIPQTLPDLARALEGLTPAIANHLWQSMLFALLAAGLALALRRNQARTRHWIWMAASLKFMVPLAVLVAIGSHFAKPRAAATAQPVAYVAMEDVSEPFALPAAPIAVPIAPKIARLDTRQLAILMGGAAWLAGALAVLGIWCVRFRRVAAAMREAVPVREGREFDALRRLERAAGVRTPIELRLSAAAMEPGIFGIARPVLAWPAGISQRLSDAQLDAVIAHEICHVRRRDNLTAAAHMLVEAVFWFHPLVWWMGSRLVEERERACDEEVLTLCRRPEVYAESILKVCEFCVESPLACVSGVTGADLKKRIVQIMTERVARKLDLGRKVLLVAVAMAVVAVPIMLGQVKAAQRMMLEAVNGVSMPFGTAAHAMIALEQTPSTGELQAADAAVGVAANAGVSGPAFAAATIRPSAKDGQRIYGIQFAPLGHVIFGSMPLTSLALFAYWDTQEMLQVDGGPKWTDTDQFDINAQVDNADLPNWDKLTDAERADRARLLTRTLLQQRFNLKGHIATIATPAYVLVQAKGGSKVKAVPAPTPAELEEDEQRRQARRPNDPPQLGLTVTPTGWVGHAVKMQELMGGIAYALGKQDKPVLDRTGMTGYYDLTLKLIKQEDGPTREQQVEDQLGLRLEARTVPMKTFVIDSAEKPKLDADESAAPASDATPPPAAPPHIHFDVVSFKRCAGDVPGSGRVDLPIDSDFVAYHCQPVRRIIYFAFTGPTPFELSGHPAWVDNDLYEFQAKVAPDDIHAWQALTTDEKRVAVRDILVEHLKLQIHVDKTPQSAYALTVAKGGAKLTEYTEGEQWKIPDGRILEGRQHAFIGDVAYFQNSSMTDLARNLAARLDRTVLDKTGLMGSYDVTLPLSKAGGANPFVSMGEDPSVESGLERLGLKLVPAKIEADGLVVDHIERPPDN